MHVTKYLHNQISKIAQTGVQQHGTTKEDCSVSVSVHFLFTLYTSDFQYSSESCHLQRYSDDTTVVGFISDG